MSATLVTPKTLSGGEIITHLINATDGEGLHFDGAAGYIDIPTVPDLGTKFSMEFIAQADSWGTANNYLVDFGTSGRFAIASFSSISYNLGVFDGTTWFSFGAKVLDDLKVHHLTVTIDGTSAILYDNANQVGTATITTPTLDACTDAAIASKFDGSSSWFDGTMYRARLWNKTLSQAEVTASYENATVPFADQYGSQTDLVNANSAGSGTAWTGATGTTPPTGWAAMGSNRVYTIDSSSGSGSEPALKINSGAVGSAGIKWGGTTTLGKKYKVTFSYKNESGCELRLNTNAGADANILADSTSWTHNATIEWTGNGTNDDFNLQVVTANKDGWFDNVSLVEIGCVADYDLAFANPTQSRMVQDRAGAADGTSSATGVVQVTPIEQLNSKSARIGTTAATPADGELLVSGNVGINSGTPKTKLHIEEASSGAVVTQINLANDNGGASNGAGVRLFMSGRSAFNPSDTSAARGAIIEGKATDTNNAHSLGFYTSPTGGVPVVRLTIDSAGNVGIGEDTPGRKLHIKGALAANSTVACKVENTGTGFAGVDLATDGTDWSMLAWGSATATPNQLSFYNGSIHPFTISSAGTVGLKSSTAMTATNGLLQLHGAGDGGARDGIYINSGTDEDHTLLNLTGQTGGGELQWINSTKVFNFTKPVTFAAGVAGGANLQNLLTNSGFDVWSNSTLEDVTGTNLTTGWTNRGGGYDTFTSSGADISSAISLDTNSNYGDSNTYTVEKGKLYRIVVTLTLNSGTAPTFYANEGDGSPLSEPYSVVLSAGANTFVYEELVGGSSANMVLFNNATCNWSATITLKEVTPGIVSGTTGPDGWTKSTNADIWREHSDGSTEAITKQGSFYALKVSPGTRYDNVHWPSGYQSDAEHLARFAGRTVTFGAWVKCVASAAVEIQMSDGVLIVTSTHTGSGNWEWLECTMDVDDTPSRFSPYVVNLDVELTDFWVSQPMLVFGSAIGSGNYSRPSGEWIDCETVINSTALNNKTGANGFTTTANTALNTEADSNGKIPKGARALDIHLTACDNGSASAACFIYLIGLNGAQSDLIARPDGLVGDFSIDVDGVVPLDANGDYLYSVLATGSNTLDVGACYATRVQLR